MKLDLNFEEKKQQQEPHKLRCPRCREFYEHFIGMPKECCPKCTEEREKQISELRDLLWQKRGLNAMKLHSMTGLPIEVITNVINEGDLEEWKIARLLELNEKGTGYHFKK